MITLILVPHFYDFILHATLVFTRSYCFYSIPISIEQDDYGLSLWTIQLNLFSAIQLLNVNKFSQKYCKKAGNIFISVQLQMHQTTDRNRHFYSRRTGVWKRRTHHLNASTRNINLTVTNKHTTEQS